VVASRAPGLQPESVVLPRFAPSVYLCTTTPDQVAGTEGSHTGHFLAEIVKPAPKRKKRARAKVPAAV